MGTPYMPIFLNLAGRDCLVVGAGPIGAQKARSLLGAGARVTLVDPEARWPLDGESRDGGEAAPIVIRRAFEAADVRGMTLVIGATDDAGAQREIYEAARAEGALVNIVDVPERCDFIYAATLERGDLQIAVSTGGRFPTLAARLRDWIDAQLPRAMGEGLEELGRARSWVRATLPASYALQRERLGRLLTPALLGDLIAGRRDRVRREIEAWRGSLTR